MKEYLSTPFLYSFTNTLSAVYSYDLLCFIFVSSSFTVHSNNNRHLLCIPSINTLSAVISHDRMWYIFISSTYTVHFSYSNSIKDCIVFFFARLTRQHSCQCCFLFSIIFLAPLIFIWLTDCIIINKVCKVCVEMISSLSISFDKHRINCEK